MKWHTKLLIITINSLLACSLAYAIDYTHSPKNTTVQQAPTPT